MPGVKASGRGLGALSQPNGQRFLWSSREGAIMVQGGKAVEAAVQLDRPNLYPSRLQ